MRRFIALTAAAALVLMVSPMREAHANHLGGHLNATLDSPGDGTVFVNRDTATVSYNVRVNDGNAVSIRSVKVTINGTVACETSYPKPQDPNASIRNVSGSFTWNTTATVGGSAGSCAGGGGSVPAGGPAANGDYTVSLTASAVNVVTDETQNQSDSAGVTTGHAPLAPTGVTASHEKGDSDIVLGWNANAEPDLKDYVVSECQSDLGEGCSDWQDISVVPASVRSVTIASAGEGSYAYRVAARRDGAGAPRMSAYTASSPATVDIDEPAPKPDKGRPKNRTTPGPAVATPTDDGTDDSASSSGGTSSGPTGPIRRIVRATPGVVTSPDGDSRGFDELLPYAAGGLALPDGGEGGGADERAVLIPLAGGALLLVLSGMAWYVNRRTGLVLEALPVEDLGEWPQNGNGHTTATSDAQHGVLTFR